MRRAYVDSQVAHKYRSTAVHDHFRNGDQAARVALDAAGVTAQTWTLILVGTSCPRRTVPIHCCRVQNELNAPQSRRGGVGHARRLARASFTRFRSADHYIATERADTVLVISGAEVLSRMLN